MAHYHIEIKGHAPVDWALLREQRDTLTQVAHAHETTLTSGEVAAIRGVRNLLDAMLDTHDGDGEDIPASDVRAVLRDTLTALEAHVDLAAKSAGVTVIDYCPCHENEIKAARAMLERLK